MEDMSKERDSQLQDLLSQIPDTLAAQGQSKQEDKEPNEGDEAEEVVLDLPARESQQQPTPSSEMKDHQHPEPIAEEPEETLTLQDKIRERQEYEGYKRLKA